MGKRVPSHCTAAGKALLAFQEDEEIACYINQPLKAITRHTITSSEDLWNDLINIRKQGYSISHGEYREMISAVAIPVFDDDNRVIVSLSVTKPTNLLSNGHIQRIVPALKNYGQLISEQLGY
ncbi:IclR family transcriptional regulator [Bacillus tuaregi]|uniref:IclR family transcriptional regulator n=1 Tax=Bacillus tuaregi TaxID=1816695 RepID=UPI0008F95401|nr:IclR family transcriptional regulator C-terminal domain-containing protein [Bacillus tuaregi]